MQNPLLTQILSVQAKENRMIMPGNLLCALFYELAKTIWVLAYTDFSPLNKKVS